MELSTAPNKNGRINIYTDGEFRFAVSAFVYRSFPWRDGDEATEEMLAELKAADDAERAHESALRMLTARAHGEKELYRKLRQKYDAEAAQSAVDRCKEAGLIDDAAFAAGLAESLCSRKGWSPERVKTELIFRGVDKNIAENTVEALDIDRDSGIIKLLDKMKITDDSPEKDKARAVRRLIAAGYGIGEIRKHLNLTDEQ
ncbi:MAG: regulatory protein RecX [Clostridia bacterium]|nr:regulatory protein RecX [Clostridia bacterium]